MRYLPKTLEALRQQTFHNFETILLDNASNDGSPEWVAENCPEVQLIRSKTNLGFAAGNNLAVQQTRGEWLVLLNPDAFPRPNWLEELLKAAESHPQFDFFSSKSLQALRPEILDGMGDVLHTSGLAWRSFYNKPESALPARTLRPREVFSACAAAAMYRRADFLAIGGFYEPFFSYHEDIDLAFRLRLQGKRCLHVPDALVEHIGSGSTSKESPFQIYHGHRNIIWTYFQDMPGHLVWKYLPHHLLALSFVLTYFTLRGPRKAVWSAISDGIRGLPRALRVRKQLQAQRKVSPQEIERVLTHTFFAPYLGSRFRKDK